MSENTQYCPYCGSQIEKGTLFCGNCGASLASIQQDSSNKMTQTDQTFTTPVIYSTSIVTPSTVYIQQKQPDTTMPLLSLIFGILGCTALYLVGGIVAVILGHMANKKSKSTNATIGLVLGYISIVIYGIGIIFYFIFIFGLWWW